MRFCGLRPGSLRAKITVSTLAVLALGLVVATCISLMGVKHYLLSAVDAELLHTRDNIARARLTAQEISAIGEATKVRGSHGLTEAADSRSAYALLDRHGTVTGLAGSAPDARQRALAEAAAGAGTARLRHGDTAHDLTVSGAPYRATALRLGDGSVLVLASEASGVGKVMAKVARLELLAGVILMTGLGTAAFLGSRRRLRPLEDMVETASAIAEGSAEYRTDADGCTTEGLGLSRRVAAPPGRHAVSEVEQLRLALNAMLHQVEASFLTREHAAAQLRRFVADASHELRTPLAAIRGYLQLYERGMLGGEGERERALTRMIAESERMGRLVDELLALARLDQRPELRPRPVDLPRLAREALEDLVAQQPRRPVEFSADGVRVLADEPLLRQIVGNLLSNVRMHTPEPARVSVAVRREDGHGVLRVSDEGPGMRPEDAERVFDRFFRADGGAGSGLGMSVVRAGAEALGGTVRVITAPGAGLSVRVSLPVDAGTAGAGPADGGPAQASAECSSTTVMSDSAPTRTGGPQAPAPRVT
ncbi:HAMP domain-containing sensor histidine kinase [Streptomyces sp. ODS28]|uniref:sensor histidine kinase n=1 Tax=Streptomyces sp. ODS28 TaxID=3136688 RepID=UPI0031E792B1